MQEVERGGRVPGREHHREEERDQRHDADPEPEPAGGPCAEAPGQEQECRPQQVELLLDAERPEVQHRGDRRRVPVVGLLHGESDVGDVDGGRRDVLGHRREAHRRQDHGGRHEGDGEHQERGGQDPPRASRVERGEREAIRGSELAQEQARDQVAGDDEEDVDADVAARELGNPGVEQHDEDDRDRPKSSRSGRKRVAPGSPLAKRASRPREARVRRVGATGLVEVASGRRPTTAKVVRVDGHDARV